jgi:predicted ATP-grasp superfamily ATP-dependent carboligase
LTIAAAVEKSPQQSASHPAPVIVLGGGVTVAAVLTLLAQAGICSYTVCSQSDFVRRSRWYRKLPSEATPSADNLAELLERLPIERAILMPCSDDWLTVVAALPASLAARFPFNGPLASTIRVLVDKWSFAQLLDQQAVPHPRTHLIDSLAQLAALPPHEFQGAILKPLSSVDFSMKYGVKGFVVESQSEALRIMGELEFPIMLQEFIPGPPTAGYFLDGFVDRDGRVCGLLARQRLRMSPPKLGNSTLMVSVPLAEVAEAEKSLRRLLGFLNYRGTFSAEFKRDQRDGQFKLFEINARPWWYIEFAARCGVDVCSMAYQDALGLPVEAVQKYEVGRRCVFFVNDIRAWKEQRKDGKGESLWSWTRPWFGADGTPFHWNDPLPAVAYARRLLRSHKVRRNRERMHELLQHDPAQPGQAKVHNMTRNQ